MQTVKCASFKLKLTPITDFAPWRSLLRHSAFQSFGSIVEAKVVMEREDPGKSRGFGDVEKASRPFSLLKFNISLLSFHRIRHFFEP